MRYRSTFSFLILTYFGRVPVKYAGGARWIAALEWRLNASEISARLFSQAWLEMSKLDKRAWSPNERIFRSGSRCRVSGNLFQPCHGRKRRNSQPAAFYELPCSRIQIPCSPNTNRLRRIDDQWLECFLFFTFRGYLNFRVFSLKRIIKYCIVETMSQLND